MSSGGCIHFWQVYHLQGVLQRLLIPDIHAVPMYGFLPDFHIGAGFYSTCRAGLITVTATELRTLDSGHFAAFYLYPFTTFGKAAG